MKKVKEFTFGWAGWLAMEIAAALPEWAWPYVGNQFYRFSNWSYGIAYPKIGSYDPDTNGGGGGIDPF